jgi:hypothetical protein
MKASGSLIAGALAPNWDAETAGRFGARLTVADMGNKASIWLFHAFARKTAGFELRVKMHRTPICLGAQNCALWERSDRFQNGHERLRWFQSTRIEIDHLARPIRMACAEGRNCRSRGGWLRRRDSARKEHLPITRWSLL